MDAFDEMRVEARVVGRADDALIGELAAQDQAVDALAQRIGRPQAFAGERERLAEVGPDLLVDFVTRVAVTVIGVAGDAGAHRLEIVHRCELRRSTAEHPGR
ncbi:hypothetical protein WPS_03540 [Vulcanimicrobium alpinum]|uniref:Uncharacterized protein n=1 Tax=Vulcanimicrobium alpinum TaxID=3016050 RepID=A0AAN1XVN7_UNVUL|nr:hypothetical protein [Vulcanimicrobium alpinum]BDE05078.1 hypothetical protein WPS_03540 [Vulcanimicrobium alpinum]